MSRRGVILGCGYVACIVGANWALSTWGVVDVLGLAVPAGVAFAGLSFGLRDALQEDAGRTWVVLLIVAGSAVSAAFSPTFAIASGVAFLVSELADMAVYSPLRGRHWSAAVVASNVVGSVVDSILFLLLAFGSVGGWLDLTIGKAVMVIPALPVVAWSRSRR